MGKLKMNFSVTRNGKPLDVSLYTWDEKNKIFSSDVSGLVLDFGNNGGVIFHTSFTCAFNTGDNCTFITGTDCTFSTDHRCTFKTGDNCIFSTGNNCTFITGSHCVFNTGDNCIFYVIDDCTFITGYYCTFNTGPYCAFETGVSCVVLRRDTNEMIKIPKHVKIKLKEFKEKGYTILKGTKEQKQIDLISFRKEQMLIDK